MGAGGALTLPGPGPTRFFGPGRVRGPSWRPAPVHPAAAGPRDRPGP